MPDQKNVATLMLEQLAAWGVTKIYGLIGDDIFILLDAIARQTHIKLYNVKHEEGAALMASAHAKLTGEIGVCIADGGPGTLHLLNGLADACMDKVPLIAITGQVSRKDIGTNTKQYVNQQSLMGPLVSYTALLNDPASTVKVMERAYRTAIAERSVVHISVPMDILPMSCAGQPIPIPPYLNTKPTSPPEVIQGALEMMRQARRPVILAGGGARGAGKLVSGLALQWGAAVMTTQIGSGVIERSHPLYAGVLGLAGAPVSGKLLNQADLCLIVGANWWPQQDVPKNIPIVQVDINPANIGSATPVAYGLVGEAETVIAQMIDKLNSHTEQGWPDNIKREVANWLNFLDGETNVRGTPVHPAFLMRSIQNSILDDCVISLDTGDNTIWFGRVFRPMHQRVVLSGKWRTMGFAIPAAVAAKINYPDKQVLALVGDGGFTMTMAEFLTAVRYNLVITIVVVNNGSFAMEKNKMRAGGLIPEGTEIYNPDFAGYARACGGLGFKVEHSDDLKKALSEALTSGRPSIVEVRTADIAVPGTFMPS